MSLAAPLSWSCRGTLATVLAAIAFAASPASAQIIRLPEAAAAYQQGAEHLAAKRYGDALASFNRAIVLDDTFAEAFLGRGDAYVGLNDDQQALRAFRDAIERNPE